MAVSMRAANRAASVRASRYSFEQERGQLMMPSASILSSAAKLWGGLSAKQAGMGIIRCSAAKTVLVEPLLRRGAAD